MRTELHAVLVRGAQNDIGIQALGALGAEITIQRCTDQLIELVAVHHTPCDTDEAELTRVCGNLSGSLLGPAWICVFSDAGDCVRFGFVGPGAEEDNRQLELRIQVKAARSLGIEPLARSLMSGVASVH